MISYIIDCVSISHIHEMSWIQKIMLIECNFPQESSPYDDLDFNEEILLRELYLPLDLILIPSYIV
jgi:hypothetical protein